MVHRVKQKPCGIVDNFGYLFKTILCTLSNLLSYFLPKGILNYFEVKLAKEAFIVKELPDKCLHSKGFYPPAIIQDFPVRKRVFFEVKRRRWVEIDTGMPYTKGWYLITKGTKVISEFALF